MRLRHAFAAAMLAVAATAACGSSDDSASDENEDDQQAGEDPGQDPGQGDGADTDEDNGDNAGGGGGDGQAGEDTPPEVGSVVEGIAVATVSGTPDEPDEQSGDVKRIGQDCFGEETMAGLAAGAAVTILDGSTGEEVGAGQIESTSAVEIDAGSDGSLPIWECSFHITATMSRVPPSIRVQVGDLEPWEVQGSINDFVVSVPLSGDSSVDTTPPPEPTEPPVDTSPPPTDPFVTSPST